MSSEIDKLIAHLKQSGPLTLQNCRLVIAKSIVMANDIEDNYDCCLCVADMLINCIIACAAAGHDLSIWQEALASILKDDQNYNPTHGKN